MCRFSADYLFLRYSCGHASCGKCLKAAIKLDNIILGSPCPFCRQPIRGEAVSLKLKQLLNILISLGFQADARNKVGPVSFYSLRAANFGAARAHAQKAVA